MESFGVDDCGSVSRSIILLSEDEITKVKVKELFRPTTHNVSSSCISGAKETFYIKHS